MIKPHYFFFLLFIGLSCQRPSEPDENRKSPLKSLEFDDVREVVILGTYHFDQETHYDELDEGNQQQLERLSANLQAFGATKVFIEKDPVQDSLYNAWYRDYLDSEETIADHRNELFQLGFRMAKRMQHDSIYLFDNRPPFIGSLEGFTFEAFGNYVDSVDTAFTKKHYEQLGEVFPYNDSLRKTFDLYTNIQSLNGPEAADYDIKRMHAVEMRAGVNDSWIGADWLGRWYQRNIRMMMHVMKQSTSEDRILLIVGSNHKWVLEQLMQNTPEFRVVDVNEFL